MTGLYVTVPIACFRKGLAREYLETELLPPPSTCYGFLLSLVGETSRRRHIGVRVAPCLLSRRPISSVLRTVWRVKRLPLGSPGNTRPDYQQLLTGIELVVWLDSSQEMTHEAPDLEQRIQNAIAVPTSVSRFGGLSLGESTHLVNEVSLIDRVQDRMKDRAGESFLLAERGRLTLPVWVDHVGSAGTRHVTGDLIGSSVASPPAFDLMPQILPPGNF